MRRLFIILLILNWVNTAGAQERYAYYTYQKETGAEVAYSKILIDPKENGDIYVNFEKGTTDTLQREEHVFGPDYATRQFHIVNPSEGTDYTGRRVGNKLVLSGRFKGDDFKHNIDLDENPFYSFPKFNMGKFIRGKSKKVTFWAIRTDTLEAYKMIGVKKGKERITLQSKPVDAIEVYMTTHNRMFRIFKRYYYYRQDGLFIKQEYPDGRVRELFLKNAR